MGDVDTIEHHIGPTDGIDVELASVARRVNDADTRLSGGWHRVRVGHDAKARGLAVARDREHRVVIAVVESFGVACERVSLIHSSRSEPKRVTLAVDLSVRRHGFVGQTIEDLVVVREHVDVMVAAAHRAELLASLHLQEKAA